MLWYKCETLRCAQIHLGFRPQHFLLTPKELLLIACCIGVNMKVVLFLNNTNPTAFSWFQKCKSVVFILKYFLFFFISGAVVCIHESKRVTGMGHYAWTSCRIQEAGKTMDALAWHYQGSYRVMIGSFKRNRTGKNGAWLVEEKTLNRERTNVKWSQEKAMANHSWTVISA